MLRTLLLALLLPAVITAISLAAPASFSASINDSIVYFLSSLNSLSIFIDVSVLYTCMRILANAFMGVITIVMIIWAFNLIS